MVHQGLRTYTSVVLTRYRTSQHYDEVLGAKIKSLVYARHFTMAMPLSILWPRSRRLTHFLPIQLWRGEKIKTRKVGAFDIL